MAYRVKLPPNRSRFLRVPPPAAAPPAAPAWAPPVTVGRRAKVRRKPRSRYLRTVGIELTDAGTTKVPLKWSATTTALLPTTSVITDDEDAWGVPLEWSCLVDLEPVDDVEDV